VFDWYQLMEMKPPLSYQAEKLGLLNQTVLQPLVPLEMVVIRRPPLGRQEEVDGSGSGQESVVLR